MNQFTEFFKKLFDYSDWPPRWHCGNWSEFHGWLYIISDLLVWAAYFTIPVLIFNYISKRKEKIRFHRLYFLFGAFILACGSTHLFDAITFWIPVYRLNALTRFATAVISWITVFSIFKILPAAFSLKSPEELETEIEQRRRAEELLKIKNKQLNEAQSIARIGHWEWKVKSNEVVWSDGLYTIYGFSPTTVPLTYENFLQCVHPADRSLVNDLIKTAFTEKIFPEYHHRIVLPDGKIKTLHARGEVITDDAGVVITMIGTSQDVTEQKKTEDELMTKTRNLESMNQDLQRFAYVASHDLQEPLRKIITFNSRLKQEYAENLDERGVTYIDKVIDASSRMQKLIHDILEFSNLTGTNIPIENVDLNEIIQQVLSNMEVIIEQSGAQIIIDKLPVIEGNPSQLIQLFQNLLVNAIKFRHTDRKPLVKITVEESIHHGNSLLQKLNKSSIIRVTDNGLGFEEKFNQNIFELFQRLHGKNDFEGTGIGLAICKKIVDNHHGIITASSKIGEGSVFNITIPLKQTNDFSFHVSKSAKE
jgi:PAS domain S-box-containing protein